MLRVGEASHSPLAAGRTSRYRMTGAETRARSRVLHVASTR
jgi:hypothetical protein